MKAKQRRNMALPALLLMCAVCAAVAVIGGVYFRFISRSIREDSTLHLREIYGQVNRAFGAFVEPSRSTSRPSSSAGAFRSFISWARAIPP